MATNAIKKRLHVYFSNDGTLLDKQGDLSANPLDDEVFEINAYIQDGVVDNQTTLINFTPIDKMAYTSHWFTMFYRELVDYVIPGDTTPTNFARFVITVPSIVLLLKSGKVSFEQRIAIVQRYGNTHLGNFETITDLNVAYPPTPTLDDNNDVAYVYSNEAGQTDQVGFYQVEYVGSIYVWVKKTTLLYNLQTKQYNTIGFTVNTGASNPSGVPTISDSIIYSFMQELSYLDVEASSLRVDLTALENKVEALRNGDLPIEFDNTGTDLLQTQVEPVIKEINEKVNSNTTIFEGLTDGTTPFTEVSIGVEPNVARIRYIHTNGNNYQVVGITYPDGREANIDEEMYVNFRNESGATRDSGIFLMTDGLSTGNQAVKGILFNPTSIHARKFLGVVTVDGVSVNEKSKATRFGIVHGIPTTRFRSTGTAYAEGQYLWATADGLLSNVAPTKPALQINVGIIINLVGGNADILVCPIVYGAFGDSSDVIITTPTNGDVPILGNDGIWRNSQRLVTVEGKVATLEANIELKTNKSYVDAQDQILDDRIDTIIAGTVEGVSGAEIVDARDGETVLNNRLNRDYKMFQINSGTASFGLLKLPSDFPVNLDIQMYRDFDGKIKHNYDFSKHKTGTKIYVNVTTGSDITGDGSLSTPYKTVKKALDVIIASVDTTFDIIIKNDEPFYRDEFATGAPYTELTNKIVSIYPENTTNKIIVTGGQRGLSWVEDGTGTWKATRNSVAGVYDLRIKDTYGNYIPLEAKQTLLDCQNETNTWYTDNVDVWVHTFDNLIPTTDIIVGLIINVANFKPLGDTVIYFESVTFLNSGGVNFLGEADGSNLANVIINDCIFIGSDQRYTATLGNAISIDRIKSVYMFNSTACYALRDGFNYHYTGLTKPLTQNALVFEYDCLAYNNGLRDTNVNNNGSTSHEGISIVRVNTISFNNKGPQIVDVGGCYSVLFDCKVKNSLDVTYSDGFLFLEDGKAVIINSQSNGNVTYDLNYDIVNMEIEVQAFKGMRIYSINDVIVKNEY